MSGLRLLPAILVLALGAAACDDPPQEVEPVRRGLPGESCQARNDCGSGLACVNQTCIVEKFEAQRTVKGCDLIECRNADDCLAGRRDCEALQQRCQDGGENACGDFTAVCTFHCDDNRCVNVCESDDACPGGWTCHGGACVECSGDMDCGDGQRCTNGRCVEPCHDNFDCPLFHSCQSGECVETGCKLDRECVALRHHAEARCDPSGGCRVPCKTDMDCDNPVQLRRFEACIDVGRGRECTYVGCETDNECRAALYGAEPVPDGVLEIVCREPPSGADGPSLPAVGRGDPGGEPPSCDVSEVGCPGGGCIRPDEICDGVPDCPGGEDESGEVCP